MLVNEGFRFLIFFITLISTSFANDFSNLELISDISSSNDVFQTILNEYSAQYKELGELEAKRILTQRDLSIVGGLNSIGLNYQRPFANFNFILSRNLAPDLFDSNRWIVTDICSIEIDATKLLTKLKKDNMIKISEKNLLAYAGVVFKRDYTWVHFAESYELGLSTHFEKLFFPFTKLNKDQITTLENNEIIFREDKISFSAGALATVPVYHGLSALAGAYLKYQLISKLEIIGYQNEGEQSHIQISKEKTKSINVGLSAEIQLDLLKILRITLFRAESSFDRSESLKIYLSIPKDDCKNFSTNNSSLVEIEKLINNKDADFIKLSQYIISEEKRTSIKSEGQLNFVLLGITKQSQTEQVEIVHSGKISKFFKHNYEKVKYQEGLLSKVFSGLIYGLTQTETDAAKLVSETKKVIIEYDNEMDLVNSKNDLFIDDNNTHLSLSFLTDFNSKKMSRGEKQVVGKMQYYIEHMTELDPLVRESFRESNLSTPFEYQSRFLVNADGVRYFNSLPVSVVVDNLNSMCEQYPKNKFFNFRNIFDHCRLNLVNNYMDYLKDLSHNKITTQKIDKCESRSLKYFFSPGKRRAYIKQCLMDISLKDADEQNSIPMWSLKKIVNDLSDNINDKVFYYNLFGIQNVFNMGFVDTSFERGGHFYTNFYGGQFKGYGVIENFKQDSIYRLPASVEFN